MSSKVRRKAHKGRIKGINSRCNNLEFGDYGVKALEPFRMTAKQIEACRKLIRNLTKRAGYLWIRVYPDVPVTTKPLETRMGKGKGNVEYNVARVKPGTVLFEISGVPETLAKLVFEQVAYKLPVKIKFMKVQDWSV